jgi:hypothetical protein
MDPQPSRISGLGPRLGVVALVLLGLHAELGAGCRAAPEPRPGPGAPRLSRPAAPAIAAVPPRRALPLAEGWSFSKFFAPIRNALGNRARMIQVATIGMCIGLYIMMRK